MPSLQSSSSQPELGEVARSIAALAPELSVASTVAIVGAKAPLVRQVGSGTLFAVAEQRFVITAAHVVRAAFRDGYTVGIGTVGGGNFTAAAGNWIMFASHLADWSDDPYDVAIYRLNAHQIARLPSASYVRISDATFIDDVSNCYFIVCGFPGMWSTTSNTAGETMKSRLLQYGTYTFAGSTAALDGYDPSLHFLIEATPAALFDHLGQSTTLETRSGHSASIPADLRGISGCSVWLLGDLRQPVALWQAAASRIIGVETGVFTARGAIKATRWNAITTLFYNAFPELRPAIDVHAT